MNPLISNKDHLVSTKPNHIFSTFLYKKDKRRIPHLKRRIPHLKRGIPHLIHDATLGVGDIYKGH